MCLPDELCPFECCKQRMVMDVRDPPHPATNPGRSFQALAIRQPLTISGGCMHDLSLTLTTSLSLGRFDVSRPWLKMVARGISGSRRANL